jgi:NADPH-dependent glutamate synthase beta subunit-like oxidoreductase
MSKDLYLPVSVGGIAFKNPFIVASGPTTKSVKQMIAIEKAGWAAASIKLNLAPYPYLSRRSRFGIFEDRNALAFTVEKRLTFEQGLRLMEESKKATTELILFANMTYSGDEGIPGWVQMARDYEAAGADAIELNMCCPNMSFNLQLTAGTAAGSTQQTGASMGQKADIVGDVVRAIKAAVKIPVIVKLTPEGGQIAQVAKACFEAGADGAGGTANRMAIPMFDIDAPAQSPYHLQDEISMSCHSGAWLKPLAQRDCYEIRKVCGPEHKIVTAGGIRTATDAIQLIMCGADLVGICTETLLSGYDFIGGVISEIKGWMNQKGYQNTAQFRDAIVPHVKSAAEVTVYEGYAAVKEANLSAPCKVKCPNNLPVQEFIRAVADRDFAGAYRKIAQSGPLQSVCGLVCDKPCEAACTRGQTGRALSIRDIKRFAVEYGLANNIDITPVKSAPNGMKVAVVGSGPAGLSAAHFLALAGYAVTIFERENVSGGMLRFALPEYRMDHAALDREIGLLTSLGVEFTFGKAYGRDITTESLKADGYQAIFLGTGAPKGRDLHIENEHAAGVYHAIDYLKAVYMENAPNLGRTTVVVGGGFTAFDAARTARRMGSEVYIAYRRTRDEMPASMEEIAEAEAEGIKIMYLVTPTAIVAPDGFVAGLKLTAGILGHDDGSGRRAPETVAGAEFTLQCDSVIAALGQQPEFDIPEDCLLCGDLGAAISMESGAALAAGGDLVEVRNIVSAIADGKRGAAAIDAALRGEAKIPQAAAVHSADPEIHLRRAGYFNDGPGPELAKPANERLLSFDRYTRALTQEEAVAEAGRCFRCGCGEGCRICKTICTDFAPELDASGRIAISQDDCVGCGVCMYQCPNQNIGMASLGITDNNAPVTQGSKWAEPGTYSI